MADSGRGIRSASPTANHSAPSDKQRHGCKYNPVLRFLQTGAARDSGLPGHTGFSRPCRTPTGRAWPRERQHPQGNSTTRTMQTDWLRTQPLLVLRSPSRLQLRNVAKGKNRLQVQDLHNRRMAMPAHPAEKRVDGSTKGSTCLLGPDCNSLVSPKHVIDSLCTPVWPCSTVPALRSTTVLGATPVVQQAKYCTGTRRQLASTSCPAQQ